MAGLEAAEARGDGVSFGALQDSQNTLEPLLYAGSLPDLDHKKPVACHGVGISKKIRGASELPGRREGKGGQIGELHVSQEKGWDRLVKKIVILSRGLVRDLDIPERGLKTVGQ